MATENSNITKEASMNVGDAGDSDITKVDIVGGGGDDAGDALHQSK
jgi:hypothetical protein